MTGVFYTRKREKIFKRGIRLSSDLGGCRFGYTADGLPGYKKEGADTVYPFSVLSYIANLQSKYGTGNNAIIRGVPANISGYELALYGFQHLYLSGAMNNAAVRADNTCANAGASAWMTTISGTYGGYYVKAGTPYIIKDHSITKDTTVNLTDDVPGYRLAGAVLQFSDYSSANSSGSCSAFLVIDYAAGTVAASTSFPVSLVTCTAKLLYLPE